MRSLDTARPAPPRIHHLSTVDIGIPIAADDDAGQPVDVTAYAAQCALVAPGDDPADWVDATWRVRHDDDGVLRTYADITAGPGSGNAWPITGAGDVDMYAKLTAGAETPVFGPLRIVLT